MATPRNSSHTLNWGKHQGRTLAGIEAAGDRGYIAWMAREATDPRERTIAREYLADSAALEEAGRDLSRMALMPAAVLASGDLTPAAKLVFAAIYTAADRARDRTCRLGNAELARATGISGKQVKRSLADLEGMGFIARDMTDPGHRGGIVITWRGDDMSAPGKTSCTPCGAPWEGGDQIAAADRNPRYAPIRRRSPDGDAVKRHRARTAYVPSPEAVRRSRELARAERSPPLTAEVIRANVMTPAQIARLDAAHEAVEAAYQDPTGVIAAREARIAEDERRFRKRLDADLGGEELGDG